MGTHCIHGLVFKPQEGLTNDELTFMRAPVKDTTYIFEPVERSMLHEVAIPNAWSHHPSPFCTACNSLVPLRNFSLEWLL
jgi:hypothetical protein